MFPTRRLFALLSGSLLSLQQLYSPVTAIGNAVLGIDLGTEYIKAALVKPGSPLEIVLTKDSRRRELAIIGFKPASDTSPKPGAYPERLYGSDAGAVSVRFPAETYPNLKALLGPINESKESHRRWRARYPAVKVAGGESDRPLQFTSEAFASGEGEFLIEELLAMQLQAIRKNAQVMAGKEYSLTDVAITVPPYYTSREEQLVRRAVELAGLRLLAFVSDGLAVGINYASSRTFDNVSGGKEPEYHIVYDVGAGSTSATVLRFQGRTVRDRYKRKKAIQEVSVLGAAWSTELCGDTLNDLVVGNLLGQFMTKPEVKKLGLDSTGDSVRKSGRAMAKLWKEAEKARQVLSANSMASVSIESFYEDIDLRSKIERKDFEKAAASLVPYVMKPIEGALAIAGIPLKTINSIILHGGGVRTPFIRKAIEKAIGADRLKTNVNADESAVFGAALRAASMMRGFRSAQESWYSDIATFSITARWSAAGHILERTVFPASASTGSEIVLNLDVLHDVTMALQQDITATKHSAATHVPLMVIQSSNLTNVVAKVVRDGMCPPSSVKASFTMRLSPDTGYPEIINATATCTVLIGEENKKSGMVENVKGFLGLGKGKSNDQDHLPEANVNDSPPEPAAEGEAKSEGSGSISSASVTSSASPGVSPSESRASSGKVEPIRPENRTTTHPFGYSVELVDHLGTSQEDLAAIKSRLQSFTLAESRRLARDEARNVLEGYIYRARDLMEDDSYLMYIDETQKNTIKEMLTQLGDWIYDEGVAAGRKAINDKLAAIKALVDPGTGRMKEGEARPDVVKRLKDGVQRMSSVVALIQGEMELHEKVAAEAASKPPPVQEESDAPHDYDDLHEDDEDDEEGEGLEESPSNETPEPSPPTASPSQPSKKPKQKRKPAAKPTPTAPPPPPFSQEDLTYYKTTYEDAERWLAAKVAEQAVLSPFQEPVLKVSELETKSKELEALMVTVMTKMLGGKGGFGGGAFGGGGDGPFGSGFEGDGGKKGKGTKGKGEEESKTKVKVETGKKATKHGTDEL